MFYLHDVVEGSNSSSTNAQNALSNNEGVLDEDYKDFVSIVSSKLEDAKHFNAVDRNALDSTNYTTSLCTNSWYLCVFFWLLDRVVHQLYVTLIYCARNGIGPTG
jgi:hypothetical protein